MSAPGLGGAGGLLLGLLTAMVLRRGGYRRADERARTRPPWSAVAAAAGVLGLAWAAAGAARSPTVALLPFAVFSVVALAAAWIDLDVRRIPNVLTGGGTLAVLAAAVAVGPWSSAARALAAGGILLTAFGLLALVSSTGGGDVKFAAVVGVVLGFESWRTVLVGVMAGLLLAGCIAAVLVLRGRSRDRHLALGPPLAAGALVALVVSW